MKHVILAFALLVSGCGLKKASDLKSNSSSPVLETKSHTYSTKITEEYNESIHQKLRSEITVDEDGWAKGPYKIYYENGNLKEEGEVTYGAGSRRLLYNSCKVGVCKTYLPDGQLESLTTYVDYYPNFPRDSMRHGKTNTVKEGWFYRNDSAIVSQGNYVDGEVQGKVYITTNKGYFRLSVFGKGNDEKVLSYGKCLELGLNYKDQLKPWSATDYTNSLRGKVKVPYSGKKSGNPMNEYFPLALGNSWTYSFGAGEDDNPTTPKKYKVTVSGSTSISDGEYAGADVFMIDGGNEILSFFHYIFSDKEGAGWNADLYPPGNCFIRKDNCLYFGKFSKPGTIDWMLKIVDRETNSTHICGNLCNVNQSYSYKPSVIKYDDYSGGSIKTKYLSTPKLNYPALIYSYIDGSNEYPSFSAKAVFSKGVGLHSFDANSDATDWLRLVDYQHR